MSVSSQPALTDIGKALTVKAGNLIYRQGELAEKCFLLVSGEVSASLQDDVLSRKVSLPLTFSDGEVLGAGVFLKQGEFAHSLVAKTGVELREISEKALKKLDDDELAEFYQVCLSSEQAQNAALQSFAQAQLMAKASIPEVDFICENAVKAYDSIQTLSEDKIDEVILDVAKAVHGQAENFAKLTVLESGMGIEENKELKIKLGSLDVANELVGKAGLGQSLNAREFSHEAVDEIAQSIGVVFAMIPVTNPVETLTFKFLSALKSRNSVIISSHRKAQNVGQQCVQLIQSILKQHGLDENLIQTPQMPPSRAITNAFMTHKNVHFILATGGPSMVHSAYCSGTPAIGVGKGNAPVWICDDANVELAAKNVVASKSFDNGIVCGSENNLLLDDNISQTFLTEAEKNGAAILDESEIKRLQELVFSSGALDSRWVGHSAAEICEFADIYRPYDIKLILAKVDADISESPFLKEKLAPVLSVSIMASKQAALEKAKAILSDEGAGHTAIIYSNNKANAQEYAKWVDVSRILVNTPGTQGCIGAANGLELSWTLGCGTQGGGSTSDNVTYKHLMNVKRIAYPVEA